MHRGVAWYAALLLIVVVVSIVIYSNIVHDLHVSSSFVSRNPSKTTATPLLSARQRPDIVVLLQRSIVDSHNQCSRLLGIDQTWAKWLEDDDSLSLCASLPADSTCLMPSLQHVSIFNLSKYQQAGISPYSNLLWSLLSFAVAHPAAQWLVLANDHTFLVLPNLRAFISSLNASKLIYTGSQLGMAGIEDADLSFASGGAGAVLSSVAAKAMLLMWLVSEQSLVDDKMESQDVSVQLSSESDYLAFARAVGQMRKMSNTATVTATARIGDMHWLDAVSQHQKGLQWRLRTSTATLFQADDAKVLRLCLPKSRWEKNNPGLQHCTVCSLFVRSPLFSGIVLATCLQHVFRISFADSRVIRESAPGEFHCEERFQCYGPVRLLKHDVDSWYSEAKDVAFRGSAVCGSSASTDLMGSEMISFHYVETAEARVLHHLLSIGADKFTASEILDMWPRNDSEVGGYAGKVKTPREAEVMRSFLGQIQVHDHV